MSLRQTEQDIAQKSEKSDTNIYPFRHMINKQLDGVQPCEYKIKT